MTRDVEQTERDLRMARLMEAADEMLRVVQPPLPPGKVVEQMAFQARPDRDAARHRSPGWTPGGPLSGRTAERSHSRRAGTVYFKPESAEVS